GDRRLVSYVVCRNGHVPSVGEVRDFLQSLPDYMAPSAVVALDSLPMTPNGKVDRRSLPAPQGLTPERFYVAPRNAREHTLADIWAKVLRIDRVGVDDSLFELGADSLHVFQISARANEAGIKVTPAQI